jgi:hypothetical protein
VKFRKERRHLAANASFPGYASVVAIASGGFATVYRAVELGTSRPVALKVLRLGDVSEPSLEPLNEQLETLGLLSKHPNVVTLYRTFFTPEGHPVLVTELCRESLAQHLHRSGPLPPAAVVPLAVKVAGALETAHQAGLVHGDVKPENILISAVGEPLLGDFGLAPLQAAAEPTEHLEGETTLHAAPEAFEEAGLTPAADVYGLASSMYQLLLGRGPFVTFPGEAPASVILRLLRDPAPRPPLGSMPIVLADLLEAGLAKDPGRRPRSAASFAEALRAIEEASGWPKTPYVVWGPDELTGAPPALRPATVRGALEAGEQPSEAPDDIEGTEDAEDIDDTRGAGGGRSVWAAGTAGGAGPAGSAGSAPASGGPGAAPLIEATWHPTKPEPASGAPASGEASSGEASSAGAQGEVPAEGGVGGERIAGPAGRHAGGEEVGDEAEAEESPAGQQPETSPGAEDAATPATGPDGAPEAEERVPRGEPGDGRNPPVTRHVIMPPAVERTVVVPEALPPRLSSTSQPAHAMQSHRRPTGIPRQAG